MLRRLAISALFVLGPAHAQNCPPVDAGKQKADEQACRAAGHEWGRFGAIAYLCNLYSCAERTRDGGKPCSSEAECQHHCVTEAPAVIGAPDHYVDYAASKGAIDTFTVGLAKEVAAEGIRVNGVRPGIIETDIHASGGHADRVAMIAPNVPMRRAGDPDEVADAVVFLLSEQASYITGAILNVSGGR